MDWPNVNIETFPRHGFPDLTGTSFYKGHAYLEVTFGEGASLADYVEAGQLTLLATHLRQPPAVPSALLEDLLVPKALRGKGMGTALLRTALTFLRIRDVCDAYLQVAPEAEGRHRDLIRLYERFGFTDFPEVAQFNRTMYKRLKKC